MKAEAVALGDGDLGLEHPVQPSSGSQCLKPRQLFFCEAPTAPKNALSASAQSASGLTRGRVKRLAAKASTAIVRAPAVIQTNPDRLGFRGVGTLMAGSSTPRGCRLIEINLLPARFDRSLSPAAWRREFAHSSAICPVSVCRSPVDSPWS